MNIHLKRLIFLICISILLVVGSKSPVHAADLFVGAATTNITPQLPVSLTGHMRTRIAKKVESEINATVLVLESRQAGKTEDYAIMVSCDLICIRGGILEAVREKVTPLLKEVDVQKDHSQCNAHAYRPLL